MTERQVQIIPDFRPDIIMVTPSYMLAIADEFARQGLDARASSLRWEFLAPSPGPKAMRKEIERAFAMDAVDIYGLSEVMGPGVANECVETEGRADHLGRPFLSRDHRSRSPKPVLATGSAGELVLTTLTKEGMPVIRYRTRDLTRLLPPAPRAACGASRASPAARDDMLIIRGVNVFPTQIEEIILKDERLSPHYALEVKREGRLDTLTIVVEGALGLPPAAQASAAKSLQHEVKAYVCVTAEVKAGRPARSSARSARQSASSTCGRRNKGAALGHEQLRLSALPLSSRQRARGRAASGRGGGAGPVGLAAAIDLGQRGVEVVVLDEDDTVSSGSRAICWAKRTLVEFFDRLGAAAPMMAKGITWNRGKLFHRDRLLYSFDLLPEPEHRFPAFINLQQYYVEAALVERANEVAGVELRWKNRVVGAKQLNDGVALELETPEGGYALTADYVIAADGAKSQLRQLLGLEFEGRTFEDRFLIADVRMKADFPTERWFWFEPPFHSGPSALLHRQADDIWRIDLQLGPEVDPEEERTPERVIPRLEAMLGPERPFELEWVSVYRFQCRMLQRFRHGRVCFAGDSAHQVSPFGARGGNSGIEDADNLAWKLELVLKGAASEALLESYDSERVPAQRENVAISSRTINFMSAKGPAALAFRDAVLELAEGTPFARAFVNSGRLSTPAVLCCSPLNTPDRDGFSGALVPGAAALDAPVSKEGNEGWLLAELGGDFTLLVFGGSAAVEAALSGLPAGAPEAASRRRCRRARGGRGTPRCQGRRLPPL